MDDKPQETHEEWISCDCGRELIRVEWDQGDALLYFSLYEGKAWDRSWVTRLKHIWAIVRKGDPWGDWAVLDRTEAKVLKISLERFLYETDKAAQTFR
jgi:hypothetical protein